jgi:hypothetical protein
VNTGVIAKHALPKPRKHGDFIREPTHIHIEKHLERGKYIPEHAQFKVYISRS